MGDVEGVEFFNFDRPACAALSTCARCKPKWVSGKTQTSGLTFTDSPNKISWKWTMGGHYEDLDGTLCGTPGCKVVQKRDINDPAKCVDDTDDEFSHIAGSDGSDVDWLKLGLRENDTVKLEGSVCDPTMKFHTVGFNGYAPTSLQFNDVVFHNEFGHAYVPWRKKPRTRMVGLESCQKERPTSSSGRQWTTLQTLHMRWAPLASRKRATIFFWVTTSPSRRICSLSTVRQPTRPAL